MRAHLTNPHAVLVYIVALIVVGYNAASPFLNPLQWENALFYAIVAIAGAIIYGHGHVTTQLKVARIVDALPAQDDGGPPTGHWPVAGR